MKERKIHSSLLLYSLRCVFVSMISFYARHRFCLLHSPIQVYYSNASHSITILPYMEVWARRVLSIHPGSCIPPINLSCMKDHPLLPLGWWIESWLVMVVQEKALQCNQVTRIIVFPTSGHQDDLDWSHSRTINPVYAQSQYIHLRKRVIVTIKRDGERGQWGCRGDWIINVMDQ